MKISLVTFFILTTLGSFAQTFDTTLTPGYGYSVVQSPEGGYVICGQENWHVQLTKADSLGQLVWTKRIGDSIGTYPKNSGADLIVLTDGGFLICGFNSDTSRVYDAYFIRTDQNGNLIWEKHYASSVNIKDEYLFSEIKQNSLGEFIVGGQIKYFSSQQFDIALMKLDSNGNQIWHKEIDLGVGEQFKDLEITDTTYTIIGESYPYNNPFILRTDSSGNMNFNRFYQSAQHKSFSDFIIDQNQNYVITGTHTDSIYSYIDLFIFNNSGDTLYYNSIVDPFHFSITVTGFFKHTDGYVIYGYVHQGIGNFAAYIKVDSLGNEKWRKLYTNTTDNLFYSGILTSNGMLAFAGVSSDYYTPYRVYLVVTDSTGAIFSSSNSAIENNLPIRFQQMTSQINILCENNSCGPFEIEIYNLLGEKLISNYGYSATTAGLTNGFYIISVADNKRRQRITSKVLIIN